LKGEDGGRLHGAKTQKPHRKENIKSKVTDKNLSYINAKTTYKDWSPLGHKLRDMYSLEYAEVLKVYFTPHQGRSLQRSNQGNKNVTMVLKVKMIYEGTLATI
jgi:hypothetical protein